MKLQLKPATATECTYAACREPAVGELRAHMMVRKEPWPVCKEHVKPEAHPPDLRNKLHRWTIVRGGA